MLLLGAKLIVGSTVVAIVGTRVGFAVGAEIICIENFPVQNLFM